MQFRNMPHQSKEHNHRQKPGDQQNSVIMRNLPKANDDTDKRQCQHFEIRILIHRPQQFGNA